MARTKIMKMRFDLTDEYDAAIYQGLAESARRAGRIGRGNQANYLVSLMLGVRPYKGLELTGLTQRPHFPPELEERLAVIEATLKEFTNDVSRKESDAPVLRLVPPGDENSPELSA